MRTTRVLLASLVALVMFMGYIVIDWYHDFYADELNLATAESVNIDDSRAYCLDGDDYELGESYGLFMTGDRNRLMAYHKTGWWGVRLASGDELMVCVTDKQQAAFEAGKTVTLHGTVTAVPEVLDHQPDPDVISYCLTCPDDGSDLETGYHLTLALLILVLGFFCWAVFKCGRRDS